MSAGERVDILDKVSRYNVRLCMKRFWLLNLGSKKGCQTQV